MGLRTKPATLTLDTRLRPGCTPEPLAWQVCLLGLRSQLFWGVEVSANLLTVRTPVSFSPLGHLRGLEVVYFEPTKHSNDTFSDHTAAPPSHGFLSSLPPTL